MVYYRLFTDMAERDIQVVTGRVEAPTPEEIAKQYDRELIGGFFEKLGKWKEVLLEDEKNPQLVVSIKNRVIGD